MITFIFVAIFIFGLLIGSFLNVVTYRFNTSYSITKGRSRCMNCDKKLKWYELLPLLSFIVQKGKCRECKNNISIQYPIIELATAVLFTLVAMREFSLYDIYVGQPHGILVLTLLTLFYFTVVSLFMIIVVYDIRHKIIPDLFVYVFIILSVVKILTFHWLFVVPEVNELQTIQMLDLLSAFLLFIPFGLMWYLSKGKWIGFGDAKLAFGIGALLGFVGGISAVVLAFWIGAIFSLLFIAYAYATDGKKMSLKTEIPFAPFLVLGVLLVMFLNLDPLTLSQFFMVA